MHRNTSHLIFFWYISAVYFGTKKDQISGSSKTICFFLVYFITLCDPLVSLLKTKGTCAHAYAPPYPPPPYKSSDIVRAKEIVNAYAGMEAPEGKCRALVVNSQ